jgi:hypothetical protein
MGWADVRSCFGQLSSGWPSVEDLLQQILCKHQDLRVRTKALYRSQVSNALLGIILRRHDLEDVKGRPGHVVPEHFKVREFKQSSGFQAYQISILRLYNARAVLMS